MYISYSTFEANVYCKYFQYFNLLENYNALVRLNEIALELWKQLTITFRSETFQVSAKI